MWLASVWKQDKSFFYICGTWNIVFKRVASKANPMFCRFVPSVRSSLKQLLDGDVSTSMQRHANSSKLLEVTGFKGGLAEDKERCRVFGASESWRRRARWKMTEKIILTEIQQTAFEQSFKHLQTTYTFVFVYLCIWRRVVLSGSWQITWVVICNVCYNPYNTSIGWSKQQYMLLLTLQYWVVGQHMSEESHWVKSIFLQFLNNGIKKVEMQRWPICHVMERLQWL